MNDRRLFWACFLSLIATAFGFIIRAMIMDDWAREFDLTETQKGEIFGAGLWPFAISIVLFSLIIDKVGYGKSMIFAFVCHVASVIITITAKEYRALYLGNFGRGPGQRRRRSRGQSRGRHLVPKEKTKWLNMLHAGCRAVSCSALADDRHDRRMGAEAKWQYKIGLILIPVIGYGVLMLGCKFPVNERVAAGISYRDMLREFGMLGALIIVTLMIREVGRVFALTDTVQIAAIAPLFGIRRVCDVVWPLDVLLPAAGDDPAGHHRARHRQLDHHAHEPEIDQHGPPGRLGARLYVADHDDLAILRWLDRSQDFTAWPAGGQFVDRRIRPRGPVAFDRA